MSEQGQESILDKLPCNYGRNDEVINIELAEAICREENHSQIRELIDGVQGKKRTVANDCIKVLYEIGERKPELIEDYVSVFLKLLTSNNNRLVWGAMTALAAIAPKKAGAIYEGIDLVKRAYREGSVITVDESISVFAALCRSGYEEQVLPILIEHLKTCRPKEVAQHMERISVCMNDQNKDAFWNVVNERRTSLAQSQIKRVNKVMTRYGMVRL